jgi:hypothetical protein
MRYLTTKGNKINFQWEPVTDMTTSLQTATQKIAHELFDSYDTFKAAEITSCRITHEEVHCLSGHRGKADRFHSMRQEADR